MKLHLTDGNSQVTMHFDPIIDTKQYQAICESKRPVSLATRFALRRMNTDLGLPNGPDNSIKMWPIKGVALENMPEGVSA